MLVEELIKKLQQYPKTAEVAIHYTYFDCLGHDEGSYCYCGDTDEVRSVESIILATENLKGRALKTPVVRIKANRYD